MEKLHEVLIAALRGENASACEGVRHRIAGMRRVAFVGFVIWIAWALGEFSHVDAVHEGCKASVDGLIAFLIERVCIVE